MKVIVDANIVFSGILNTNGKIGDLLLNSEGLIEFISARYMFDELIKYYPKIQNLTGKTFNDVGRIHYKLTKTMKNISENQVPKEIWRETYNIMKDIDPKDTPYLALSKYLQSKIWTGDKALKKGLLKKGLDCVVTTDELFKLRDSMIRK